MSKSPELCELSELEIEKVNDDSELDRHEQILLEDSELDQYFDQSYDDNQIILNIIQERNEEIRTLADDMALLKEIFVDCANMVFGQGESLNEAENSIEKSVEHTEDAAKSLEKAVEYQRHGRGRIFDACVMAAGVGLGSIGWIGGPWVGVPAMAAGLGLSGSVVIARNKLEETTSIAKI